MLMKMVRKMMPMGDRALSGMMRVRIANFPLRFVNRRVDERWLGRTSHYRLD
jgi:hypothetical protein